MNDIKEVLAINLKYYRKRQNISQEELAFESGLHRTYISSIECDRRNVSIENLAKIADVLNVEPYMLLKEKERL